MPVNNSPLESLAAFAIAFAAGAVAIVAIRTYGQWVSRGLTPKATSEANGR